VESHVRCAAARSAGDKRKRSRRQPPAAGATSDAARPRPLSADLVNVFEVFLPQLLLYPNPTDPLNGEAAALLMREPDAYSRRVRDHTARNALPAAAGGAQAGAGGKADGGSSSEDDGAEDYMSSEDDAAGVEV